MTAGVHPSCWQVFSNEVATMKAKFVGLDAILQVEALQRVGAKALDDVAEGHAVLIKGLPKKVSRIPRSRSPSQFRPEGKINEVTRG